MQGVTQRELYPKSAGESKKTASVGIPFLKNIFAQDASCHYSALQGHDGYYMITALERTLAGEATLVGLLPELAVLVVSAVAGFGLAVWLLRRRE